MVTSLSARIYLHFLGAISPDNLKKRTIEILKKYERVVEHASSARLDASPTPGKWCAAEIVYHATSTSKAIFRTSELLRAGRNVPDTDPSSLGRTKLISRNDLLAACKHVRELAQSFNFHVGKTGTSSHPIFGPCDAKKWLVINLFHLERHYRQLTRTLAR